jgi:hypothetical protein
MNWREEIVIRCLFLIAKIAGSAVLSEQMQTELRQFETHVLYSCSLRE